MPYFTCYYLEIYFGRKVNVRTFKLYMKAKPTYERNSDYPSGSVYYFCSEVCRKMCLQQVFILPIIENLASPLACSYSIDPLTSKLIPQ